MAKNKTPHFDPQWAKAKNVCRLNMEDIRMAKALGMSPKALLKNNPSPAQRWKAPVKHWIRELYERRFGRSSKTFHEADARSSRGAMTEATSQPDHLF